MSTPSNGALICNFLPALSFKKVVETEDLRFNLNSTFLKDLAIPEGDPIFRTKTMNILASEILEAAGSRLRLSSLAPEDERPRSR